MTCFAFGAKCGARGRRTDRRSPGAKQPLVEQRRERDAADAEPGLLEEVAARDRAKGLKRPSTSWPFLASPSRPDSAARWRRASTPPARRRRCRPPSYPLIASAAAAPDRCGSARAASRYERHDPLDLGRVRRCASRRAGTRTRARWLVGPATALRAASARPAPRAASKDASSFSIVSACSGVFVRTRRTVVYSRLVASNVMKLGYGDRPADEDVEPAAVPVLALARRPLLAAVGHVPDAVGLRRKDARAADLRPQQPARRQHAVADHLGFQPERGPRASSRLYGSRSTSAGVARPRTAGTWPTSRSAGEAPSGSSLDA